MSALDFAAIARALIDAPSAWLPEPALAAALGLEPAELGVAVDGLVAGGLLERWAAMGSVTLSPAGASQLGVRLVAGPGSEVYRWSTDAVSARSRRPSRRQLERMHDHDALLREVVDPKSIEREPRPRSSRPPRRTDEAPKPTLILCGCEVVWTEVRTGPRPPVRCAVCAPRLRRRRFARPVAPGKCSSCGYGCRKRPRLERCPACHGEPLGPTTYCLRCDRWGLDGWFARRGMTKTKRPKRKAS